MLICLKKKKERQKKKEEKYDEEKKVENLKRFLILGKWKKRRRIIFFYFTLSSSLGSTSVCLCSSPFPWSSLSSETGASWAWSLFFKKENKLKIFVMLDFVNFFCFVFYSSLDCSMFPQFPFPDPPFLFSVLLIIFWKKKKSVKFFLVPIGRM